MFFYFYIIAQIIMFVNQVNANPAPNKPLTHEIFQKEIASSHKNKSGYVCKKVEVGLDYCNCVYNGQLPKNFKFPNPDSADFTKIVTMPVCGNPFFDNMKLCSFAHFFNDTYPTNAHKEDKHNPMFVILDGCATCSKGGIITGLSLTHFEASGGFFSKCSEEHEYTAIRVGDLNIKMPASKDIDLHTAKITLPAIMQHRQCGNIFNIYEASNKYEEMKLHIEHNCGGTKATMKINLPTVDINDFKDRVAELRGLLVNLDDGTLKQFTRKGNSFQLNNTIASKWMDPKLKCSTSSSACVLN